MVKRRTFEGFVCIVCLFFVFACEPVRVSVFTLPDGGTSDDGVVASDVLVSDCELAHMACIDAASDAIALYQCDQQMNACDLERVCDEDRMVCLSAAGGEGTAIMECELRYDACVNTGSPTCEDSHALCLTRAEGDPEATLTCDQLFEDCTAPPPSCDLTHASCIDESGGEPMAVAACDEALLLCSCDADHATCVEASAGDPDALAACESTFSECLGGSCDEQHVTCITDGGATDTCDQAFLDCLQMSGEGLTLALRSPAMFPAPAEWDGTCFFELEASGLTFTEGCSASGFNVVLMVDATTFIPNDDRLTVSSITMSGACDPASAVVMTTVRSVDVAARTVTLETMDTGMRSCP